MTQAGNANIGVPYVPGDSDLDGDVDSVDLNALGINWQRDNVTTYEDGDFNGDGLANAVDLNSIGVNWQHGVPAAAAVVPEPSSGLLVLIAGLALLRRRR